jgi:minor extracellular serine protease Vpr
VAGIGIFLAVVLAAGPTPRPEVQTNRLVRMAGKADLRLWRHVLGGRLVFGPTRKPVFVRPTTPEAKEALERLGVASDLGRWKLVRFDDARLLSAIDAGEGLELSSAPAHRPLLQYSAPDIHADAVWGGRGVDLPRTGKNVLIGIIDTGIDLNHPAFFKSGKSRVVAAWDQDASGSGTAGFDYGRVCDEEELAQDECHIEDSLGHGTHVAGIAGGSRVFPRADGSYYGGIAPDADFALVRSDNFTRLADAVDFLMAVARDRAQPLVINISVGGQYGPHDGMTPLEDYLANAVGPGRIIVVAAGNDGAGRIHLGTNLSSTPVRIGLEDLPVGRPTDVSIDLWSRPEGEVELALELWVNGQVVAEVPFDADAYEIIDGKLTYGTKTITSFTYGVDVLNGHRFAQRTILLDMSQTAWPSGATLALRLSGKGRVDGWIAPSDYGYGSPRFAESRGTGWIGGDGYASLTVPGTGPKLLSVGAYTTHSSWGSSSGTFKEENLGAIAEYSSQGPTLYPELTGIKPDLCAPGSVIASARAFGMATSSNDLEDGLSVVMQGTSMAAPHVTGVVALMLEANPDLGPINARRFLQYTARTDEQTGVVPNMQWGYGKVDAQAAVHLAERSVDGGCAAVGPSAWTLLLTLAALSRRRSSRSTKNAF